MKVIIYGNNGEIISKLGELVEKTVLQAMDGVSINDIAAINNKTNKTSIADTVGSMNEENFELAIFIGVAPLKEVEFAVQVGMKVLILLAPVIMPMERGVTVGVTKVMSDKKSLRNDVLNVFKNVA